MHLTRFMRQGILGAATVGLAVTLTACGGATVDNSESVSVEPLSRAKTTETSQTSEQPSEQPSQQPSEEPKDEPAPENPDAHGDVGAREIQEVPAPDPALTEQQQAYLNRLSEGGIDVEPARDQLLGAATSVCADPQGEGTNAIALAVGGQLVEQGHTQLTPEDAGKLVEQSARETYC